MDQIVVQVNYHDYCHHRGRMRRQWHWRTATEWILSADIIPVPLAGRPTPIRAASQFRLRWDGVEHQVKQVSMTEDEITVELDECLVRVAMEDLTPGGSTRTEETTHAP